MTTVGLRNSACDERSYNSGARPRTVVAVVSSTGRNRSATASTIAGRRARVARYSSMVEISTMESLMMIPDMPIRPTTENRLSGRPQAACPQTAPISPKGMTDITTRGRVQLAKIHASTM